MTVRTSCKSICPTDGHNDTCEAGGPPGRCFEATLYIPGTRLDWKPCVLLLCADKEQIPQGEAGMNRRLGPNFDCSGYSEWISNGEILIDTPEGRYGGMQMPIE